MSAGQWHADVTVKRPGVRAQTTDRLTGTWWDLLGNQLPGYGTGVESAGGRVVRIVLRPEEGH